MDKCLKKAKNLDKMDPLSHFRDQFIIDDPSLIYLDGNSLGRLPTKTVLHLKQVIYEQWGSNLINSWNQSWYSKSLDIGNKIAKLIGADEGEVIISDNTSTNLYKLAWAALNLQNDRNRILTDDFNFPSDVYILDGLFRQFANKKELKFIKSHDGITMDDELSREINEDTALVTLSQVAFKSAFMYDMKKVTQIVHKHGALMLWDLSHSVGAVPIDLQKCNVDLAVGCTYKYLNGGPGAPAFLFVRKELQEKLSSPIQGWFGADNPFEFGLDYIPAKGITKFLSGTPPILSLAAIEQGINQIVLAGMENLRDKSIQLSSFFIELFDEELSELGFSLASPREVDQRGSHISIQHKEALRIIKALMDKSIDSKSIVPDFRTPDNIRFGFAALYNSFEEVYATIQKLKKIVALKLYERYDISKKAVT